MTTTSEVYEMLKQLWWLCPGENTFEWFSLLEGVETCKHLLCPSTGRACVKSGESLQNHPQRLTKYHFLLMKMTNKMQLCRIIYCSLTALHVSSDNFAQHQEHHNCIYSFWYYSRMWLSAGAMDKLELIPTYPWLQPAATYVNNTRSCKYSCDAPDVEQK